MNHSIARDAGQLIVAGFPGAHSAAPDPIQEALSGGSIGGVILFRRNVEDVAQVSALNASLHACVSDPELPPPFVCVDQEGGRVVRLRAPLTPVGPMREAAALGARGLARLSEVVATELCALGFNVNFAPVLDVDTNPDNPVIGDRAFSDDPEAVARLGGAFIGGHLAAGVVPCAKHFPGHGDTSTDSHLALPTLTHRRERLDAVELLPFRRVAQIAPMIMTAHVVFAGVDPVYPATLSEPVIGGVLRREIGYQGVVVSDCLEMKAVADHYDVTEMIELGVRAGVDLFLICHTEEKWRRAWAHLVEVSERDPGFAALVRAAAARVRALKREQLGSWPRPWAPQEGWEGLLGAPEHVAALGALRPPSAPLHDPTEA